MKFNRSSPPPRSTMTLSNFCSPRKANFIRMVVIALCFCTYYYVGAVRSFETTAECNACFDRNGIVCRSRHTFSESFCCDKSNPIQNCTTDPGQPDLSLKVNGRNYDLCSHEINEISREFTCPYRPKMCNQENPTIYLDPVSQNETTLAISDTLFRDGESCYYNIIPQNYLGPYDYQLDLDISLSEGVLVRVLNGTSYETAGNQTIINPKNQNTWRVTRNATQFPWSGKPNNLYIYVMTDPSYVGAPAVIINVGLRAQERMIIQNQTGGSDTDIIFPDGGSEVEEKSNLQIFSTTVIESLETSSTLTLNEKVVIISIFTCLVMHCGKAKLCPKSWEYKNSELEKQLIAKQLAKSAFDELD